VAIKCPKCLTENPDTQKFCGECATPLPSSKDIGITKTIEAPVEKFTRGTTFADRYEIIEELGSGGMGKVYRVDDTKTKEEIALKLIKPEIALDKKTIERFRNELTTARKIRHKNVCGMYDLGEHEGTYFITMEYVSGEDLKSLVRRVKFDTGTVIKIAKQVCEGLSEAHRLGVIHRDLKPSNIMIDKEGSARIMDFGIARLTKTKGITGAGVMIGTPEYMSPEQVDGKETDPRSDIYSLGVILYEISTGRLPFEGDTPLSIAVQHRSDMPKDPREFNAQIAENLCRLILRCLEKQKKDRYQNADEVYVDLAQIEQGMPTIEREAARKKPLTSKEITVSFSLKKLFIPIVVVLAVLIAALIILIPWSRDKAISVPTDKPSIAVLPFENNTGDENQDQLRDSLSDQLTADLYQSKYLHVLSSSHVYGILKRLNLLQAEKFSFEDLQDVANQGGASHILTGSYSTDGDVFLITVFLNRMDAAEDTPSFTVKGPSAGNISALVDDITKKIKTELNLTQTQIASDIDREAARITSSSPEALQLYSKAKRKYYDGDQLGAIHLFEEALAIDPDFAMAIRGMAQSYWGIGAYGDKAINLFQEALKLAKHLPDRERLQIKGELDSNSWRLNEAVAGLTELLKLHPYDTDAHGSLALAYRRMGEPEKEIESLKRAIQYGARGSAAYTRLAHIYRSQGFFSKADETIKLYVDNFGDHPVLHRQMADQFMVQRDYNLALSEINKAIALNPANQKAILSKGDIYFYMGELVKAEEEYRKLLQHEDVAYYSYGLARLTDLYSLQGKFKASQKKVIEGIERAEKAEEIHWISGWYIASVYIELASGNFEPALRDVARAFDFAGEHQKPYDQTYCLVLKGLIFLRKRSMDSVQKTADELKQFMEQNEIANASYYDFLLGSIELERGNYSKAVRFLEKVLMDNDNDIEYSYSAAQAYYGEGNLEKAQKVCEKILSLTLRRYGIGHPRYFDLFAKSYYILGKIYEKKGWPGKAIEHYEKFLDLWKDADPGIVEVEDARKRLAGLKKD